VTAGPLRVLPLAAALCVAACGGSSQDIAGMHPAAITVGTALAAEQVLSRAEDGEPDSLDPALVAGVSTQYILDDLFEGLTTLSADGHVVPGVASSWDVSADGRTWVFHLRPTARWSNGAPVTAADFVFGWQHTADPKTGASYAQAVAPVENAYEVATGKRPVSDLGVEAVDEHTLRVHLSEPAPYFAYMLSNAWMYPVYAPALKQYGDQWTQTEHFVSNGPFKLVEHVIGNRIVMERNPYYWDAQNVRLTRVIHYVVEDRNTQAQRFMAGQVQYIATFPTPELPWLKPRLGDQVVMGPYFGTMIIGMNMEQEPFRSNRKLRQALAMAVDSEMITSHVLNSAGFAAYTMMPELEGYSPQVPDWARLPTAERHALARRLYHEAGYSDAHPLRTELAITSGDAISELEYEAIVAMWREVLGAEVSLHAEEFKILLQDNHLHKNILFHNAWIGDYPDPYTFMQLYTTGFDMNYGGYSNRQYDALVAQAQQEPDNARRYRLFEQAEHLLNDDAAYIAISYYSTRHLIKPYLKGWASNNVDRNLSRYMYLLEHQGS
jgi:oligopeptide transport system substrate-binding protein